MPPFPLLNEKLLVEPVKIISWCPTADLVLLISPNNSLTLYRNVIDLVWHLKDQIESNINIVTWKPNGKEFVLGCDNGVVYKVDITHHSPNLSEYVVDNLTSPITTLSWITYEFKKKQINIEGFDPDAFDIEASLPTLSEEEPPAEPHSRIPRSRSTKRTLPPKPLQSTESQTLLFIGNKKGGIHIFLNGIYPIGFVDIKCDNKSVSIINISVADNAASLQILAKPEDSEKEYILYFLDTHILELRKKEIFSISEIQTELNYLLQYTSSTTHVLKRYHDAYTRATKTIVTQANDIIIDSDDVATAMPEVELIGTLATGNITKAIQDMFTQNLDTQRIKQWDSNVNCGYKNSQAVLCEHILPACERIQLALSKLLGYSLWKQRYGDFLEVEAVKKCIVNIQKLIVELHHFSKSLNSVMKRFSAFIAWITTISHKVDGGNSEDDTPPTLCDEPQLVAEYLNKDFTKDSLAEYFCSSATEKPKKNLLNLLSDLNQSCVEMLDKPSTIVSNKIQVASCFKFHLKGVFIDKQPRERIVSIKKKYDVDTNTECTQSSVNNIVNKNESVVYAFMKTDGDSKLLLLHKTFDTQPLQYAQFDLNGDITDFEFFDQKELGILVQTDRETSTLQTVLIDEVRFKRFGDSDLISSEFSPSREQTLEKMIRVKIGCNGLPRRRLFGLVGYNDQLKVHFMSGDEDSSDEDTEDEE